MEAAPPPAGGRRHKCRYGEKCRLQGNPAHVKRFWHPNEGAAAVAGDAAAAAPGAAPEPGDLSRDGDQHAGTKFPRLQCQYHPGCKKRWTCWYSHGLIHAAEDAEGLTPGVPTCFLGQAPHNQGCMNPTWNGEPFDFCSKECREMAKLTPKGPLSCRRHNCACPCTVNGMAGQFCCKTCYDGKPCKYPTHTAPTAHLVIVAKPQKGKFAPCAREGCACAAEGGCSWDGKPGQYCCRACRNGTPCTKMWHTEPENARSESVQEAYVGFVCALDGCEEPTWNGRENEYCCMEHRHIAMGNYVPPEDGDISASDKGKTEAQKLLEKVHVPSEIPFPNFAELWRHAFSWAHAHSGGAHKGKVAKVWFNESLASVGCPARRAFEKAVDASKCDDFRKGEFGWHGTKSIEAINGICWSSLDTARRSGQACGPGEYFSRGTQAGLNYSEGYAGGTAGNLLIVFWIMSHELGGAPTSPAANGAGITGSTGHIVCNNPTTDGKTSTGVMYCVPVAVVAFGSIQSKPNFRTFNPQMQDPDISDLLRKVQEKSNEKQAKESDKVFLQAEQLMLAKSEALLKNALEGTDVEALQSAIAVVQKHCLVDTSLLDKAQTMIGPKCREQLEAASASGSNPDSLQKAIAVAEKLSASGGAFVDKKLVQTARERLPFIRCEYQLRIALDTGDIAALRGAIRRSSGVEGLDPTILQDACRELVSKVEDQLRVCMAGADPNPLQKAIKQADTINDGLPKDWDKEEDNWVPAEDVPHIDESLVDEARKRLLAMKYENGLRATINQIEDGSAPPAKLAQSIKQSEEIEGVSEELLTEARELMVTQCDRVLNEAKTSGDTSVMMAAVVLCTDIPGVNAELLDGVTGFVVQSCETKVQEIQARLTAACDGHSAAEVHAALEDARAAQAHHQKVLDACKSLPIYEDLRQRLALDDSLLTRSISRRTVIIYEELLGDLIDKVSSRVQHVANLKFWVDQSAMMPALANVDPELIARAQAAIIESCHTPLQEVLLSGDLVDAQSALSWCTGIDGVDESLLESVRELIASRCEEMVAEHQEALLALIPGDDLGALEKAIQDAQKLPDVVPKDPNLGHGGRLPNLSSAEVQKAILDARTCSDAVPKNWSENDGKPRIREDLLRETRQRLIVDKTLLNDASKRLAVLKSEAALRDAAAGDDLAGLQEAIAGAEKAGMEDVDGELLAQTKTALVQKAEMQLAAACEGGIVKAIQAKIDQVSSIPGVCEEALKGAGATMVKICEDELRTSISGTDPAKIIQALARAEPIPGVDVSILKDARARVAVLTAEQKLDAASKARDVANLKSVLQVHGQVEGVSPSVIENAKQTLVQVCEEGMRAAMAAGDATELRQAIDKSESVDGIAPELMEEARQELQKLEKPKSLCCTIV